MIADLYQFSTTNAGGLKPFETSSIILVNVVLSSDGKNESYAKTCKNKTTDQNGPMFAFSGAFLMNELQAKQRFFLT